jgi:hypothetical protein
LGNVPTAQPSDLNVDSVNVDRVDAPSAALGIVKQHLAVHVTDRGSECVEFIKTCDFMKITQIDFLPKFNIAHQPCDFGPGTELTARFQNSMGELTSPWKRIFSSPVNESIIGSSIRELDQLALHHGLE